MPKRILAKTNLFFCTSQDSNTQPNNCNSSAKTIQPILISW